MSPSLRSDLSPPPPHTLVTLTTPTQSEREAGMSMAVRHHQGPLPRQLRQRQGPASQPPCPQTPPHSRPHTTGQGHAFTPVCPCGSSRLTLLSFSACSLVLLITARVSDFSRRENPRLFTQPSCTLCLKPAEMWAKPLGMRLSPWVSRAASHDAVCLGLTAAGSWTPCVSALVCCHCPLCLPHPPSSLPPG